MGELFQVLIANGHNFHALRYEYSMSQVYLFFEKIKKIELNRNYMDAVVFANCLVYATPANDASEARNKNRSFKQFMDGLDWDRFVEKAEEKLEPATAEHTLKRLFGGVGIIPIRNKSKK